MNGCWDTYAQDKTQLFKRPRELHGPSGTISQSTEKGEGKTRRVGREAPSREKLNNYSY